MRRVRSGGSSLLFPVRQLPVKDRMLPSVPELAERETPGKGGSVTEGEAHSGQSAVRTGADRVLLFKNFCLFDFFI